RRKLARPPPATAPGRPRGGPPPPPPPPPPRRLGRAPVPPPAGTLTLRAWTFRSAPEPPHVGQGLSMIVPWPLQAPHVLAIEKKPCWKRIWPEPPHSGQRRGWVPARVPRPSQSLHFDRRGMEIVFSAPRAASSKSSSS